MPAMTRQQKVERFRAIEGRLGRLSIDWQRGSTPKGEGILARAIMEQALEPILTFDAWADRDDIEFVSRAPGDMRFLVDLVRELDAAQRTGRPAARRPPDYAAECAMKCADPAFQSWLFEVHGLENPDSNRAATKVRFLLAIESRAQLNTDAEAVSRWRAMVGDFERWNRERRR